MKPNRIILPFSVLLLASQAYAADPGSFRLKMDDQHMLVSSFAMEKYLPENARKIASEGVTAVTVNQGICWTVKKPVERSWFVENSSGSGENQSTDTSMRFITGFFMDLIRGDYDSVKKSFRVSISQKDPENGEIYLHPEDADLSRILDLISIKIESGFVSNIRIIEKAGGSTSIVFSGAELTAMPETSVSEYCSAPDRTDRK